MLEKVTNKTTLPGELGAYVRMEKELTGVYRKTTNIIGIQYVYTIKAKKI